MRLEFHPDAEVELIEAAEYYESHVPGWESVSSPKFAATDLLLDHPEIGVLADSLLRMLVLSHFPFTLYYSVTPDVVRIKVVAHQSRRPGYGAPGSTVKSVCFAAPIMKSPRVVSDPEILGGTPVFFGTRVPVRVLFEYLEAGDSLEVFLEDFPSVSQELAVQVLEDAKRALEAHAHPG